MSSITLRFWAIDQQDEPFRIVTCQSQEEAKKIIVEQLGPPEVGSTYAISGDGVAKVTVTGSSLHSILKEYM